eukprot:SAG22_NODE_15732_length_342_cov_0.827160_1_plen_62_part_10
MIIVQKCCRSPKYAKNAGAVGSNSARKCRKDSLIAVEFRPHVLEPVGSSAEQLAEAAAQRQA